MICRNRLAYKTFGLVEERYMAYPAILTQPAITTKAPR